MSPAKTLADPPMDFGQRARIRRLPFSAVGLVLGIVAAVAILTVGKIDEQRADEAELSVWNPVGPPCPSLSVERYTEMGLQAPQANTWGGTRFARWSGGVSCALLDAHAGLGGRPVCQFTSPWNLVVTTPRGVYYFLPGVGKPATISVTDGLPSCVMASNFTARDDRT